VFVHVFSSAFAEAHVAVFVAVQVPAAPEPAAYVHFPPPPAAASHAVESPSAVTSLQAPIDLDSHLASSAAWGATVSVWLQSASSMQLCPVLAVQVAIDADAQLASSLTTSGVWLQSTSSMQLCPVLAVQVAMDADAQMCGSLASATASTF